MKARGVSTLLVEVLLVLVAVAAAVTLYIYLSSTGPRTGPGTGVCVVGIDAVKANESGIYLWVTGSGRCVLNVSRAYMERVGGGAAAVLEPLNGTLTPGRPTPLRLLPESMIQPGEYVLRAVLQGGGEASTRLLITSPVPEATIARGDPGQLNKTINRRLYNVTVTVTTTAAGNYNVSVSVCPVPGVTMTYVRGEIYNATMQPPKWVGKYYVYVDPYTPYTYPLCSLWYWAPIAPSEFPVTLLVLVEYTR